jgi:hypothetical protein
MLGCDLIFATGGGRESHPTRGNIFGGKMP